MSTYRNFADALKVMIAMQTSSRREPAAVAVEAVQCVPN